MANELQIDEVAARGYPPAVLYLRNGATVTTEVCAYNCFSIFLKEHPDADCYVLLFDSDGRQVGYHKELGRVNLCVARIDHSRPPT
jgi:hypothetical protein